MGCISSKNVRSYDGDDSPQSYYVPVKPHRAKPPSSLLSGFGPLEKITEESEREEEDDDGNDNDNDTHSKKISSHKKGLFSFKFGRLMEAEHVAAGWPAWLSAVAAEAIDGWLPLRSDSFQRLEKIGRGSYSNVYRARNLESGKMYAVKKVRYDNFKAESVRFMAREIQILRKLDHPNVMKLEGIITSRASTHIYLVFDYMEHDLAGLLSSPHVKFTHAQIKCYMRQLLSGLEHCHSQGILHRDIKTSNILVNNEGVLKIGDFGLANYMRPNNKNQELTSRVVTLWYRAPELLLGATRYGVGVDIWSVGCVFAELFIGRPVLKGRTEVEQLHKIFKLCGSPTENDDYWKSSRLPLAKMFKPQQPYESTLFDRFRELPKSAVPLLHTFLSIDPYSRGSATSALFSSYFSTKPYACDPWSLPKYPPSKEIDAKSRDDRRKRSSGTQGTGAGSRRPRNTLQESSHVFKFIPSQERAKMGGGSMSHSYRRLVGSQQQWHDTVSEAASHMTEESVMSTTQSVPVQAYAWSQRQNQQPCININNDMKKKKKGRVAFSTTVSYQSPQP